MRVVIKPAPLHSTRHVSIGDSFERQLAEQLGGVAPNALLSTLAFGVLPTIIFFSALMSVLYYVGIMPRIVKVMAWIMSRRLPAMVISSTG